MRWTLDQHAQLGQFLRRELPTVIILVITIPLIVWYALKLWLEGEPSPFPEIDRVWNAALREMKEQSIDPAETPIFLVLGPSSADAANAFVTASNVQFPVSVPSGPAPAHVFANQQSIYIVCTQSCCLGTLLGAGVTTAAVPTAAPAAPYDAARTMQVGLDDGDGIGKAPPPDQAPTAAGWTGMSGQAGEIRGTMMVDPTAGAAMANRTPSDSSPVAHLDPGQSGEATAKLAYLCRCIRRVRDPLCPINGVLVATPFRILADGTQDAVNHLQTALKADLAALRGATRVRCGVTHIIEGMEQEPGFRELIRRVGTERASTQRFGKGFGIWNLPIPDQLDALVKHACGAFEDWSYLLFREEEGLSKRGNRHLYGLLCRIRMNFLPRLRNLIQSSYALDQNANSIANREPLLFSGCYFVANGATPDRQAFLASVFRKTQTEEEELEWGSEAIGEEKRMQAGVQLLLIINGVLVAAIVAMLLYARLQS